jgi:rhodanese-related sulfurtransferase
VSEFVVVEQLKEKCAADQPMQLVDVRSPSEYGTGHLAGSLNIPLEQIESRLDEFGNYPIVLICKTGKRARMAAGLLRTCREDINISVLGGGTDAWTKAGYALVRNVSARWSLERQVRLGAGAIVLAGAILGLMLNPHWIYLSAFVGLGLSVAGLTDFCPMALLLGKMPWNRPRDCAGPIVDSENRSCCN